MDRYKQDDRILPITRIVAGMVIPFLVLAFIILFIFPHLSAERFSWEINPPVMAAFMGSGYLGGAFLFIYTLFGKRWHHVANGFPGVTAFTWVMLLTTIIHWARFDINHFPFQLWLGLYVITPFLIPWLWQRNRAADPHQIENADGIVSPPYRWAVRVFGVGMIAVALAGFLWPNFLMNIWPWSLTPLLARILAGWGALLGMGSLMISFDARWSAWRVPVGSIAIWYLLYLLGSWLYRQDFRGGAWLNWFNIGVIAMILFIAAMFITFERKKHLLPEPQQRS